MWLVKIINNYLNEWLKKKKKIEWMMLGYYKFYNMRFIKKCITNHKM